MSGGGAAAILLGIAAMASISVGQASSASADYQVEICTDRAGNAERSLFETAPPIGSTGFEFTQECGLPFGGVTQIARATSIQGASLWKLEAAPNTTIKALDLTRAFFTRPWSQLFQWFLRTPAGNLETAVGTAPSDGANHLAVNATSVISELRCVVRDCGVNDEL